MVALTVNPLSLQFKYFCIRGYGFYAEAVQTKAKRTNNKKNSRNTSSCTHTQNGLRLWQRRRRRRRHRQLLKFTMCKVLSEPDNYILLHLLPHNVDIRNNKILFRKRFVIINIKWFDRLFTYAGTYITIRWVAAKGASKTVYIRACSLGLYVSCALYGSQKTDTSSLQAFSNQWSSYKKAINLLRKIA